MQLWVNYQCYIHRLCWPYKINAPMMHSQYWIGAWLNTSRHQLPPTGNMRPWYNLGHRLDGRWANRWENVTSSSVLLLTQGDKSWLQSSAGGGWWQHLMLMLSRYTFLHHVRLTYHKTLAISRILFVVLFLYKPNLSPQTHIWLIGGVLTK